MKILFICRHNRFRSKVAEALFKKYNKNKKIKTESAGIDLDNIPVADNVIKALKKFKIKKINRKPREINGKLIKNSDLIVIVANNVKKSEMKNMKDKKIIIWKISDTKQDDYPGILMRTKQIEKKVKGLISDI